MTGTTYNPIPAQLPALTRFVRRAQRLHAAIEAHDMDAIYRNRVSKPAKWRAYDAGSAIARYMGVESPHTFAALAAIERQARSL